MLAYENSTLNAETLINLKMNRIKTAKITQE
jgi:hypothetical protein